MKRNRKSSRPSTAFDQARMVDEQSIVNEFLRNRDVPAWYRGMSNFQLDAANRLQNALRDDIEQATSHRVLLVLTTIGIKPIVGSKSVRMLMNLSRGSDLAFLWFLNDTQYKTKGDTYTINEQLIMSSIAHLDLRYTLRGLQQILPPAQPPKKKHRRKRIEKQFIQKMHKWGERVVVRADSTSSATYSTFKTHYHLPYFQKPTRPRPYGKSLHVLPPEYTLKMRFSDIMNNNFSIPNETNRWFGSYEMSDAKRMASCIIRDKLIPTALSGFSGREPQRLIKASDLSANDKTTQAAVFDRHLFKHLVLLDESAPVDEGQDKTENDGPLLCERHKVIHKEKELQEHETIVLARDKILNHFDIDAKKKKACTARIRKQIEHDVTLHMENIKRNEDKSYEGSYMKLVTSNEICECDPVALNKENVYPRKPRRNNCIKPPKCAYKFDECGLNMHAKKCKQEQQKSQKSQKPLADITHKHNNTENISKKRMDVCTGDASKAMADPGLLARRKSARLRRILCGNQPDSGYDYIKSYDYGHTEQPQTKTNDKENANETFFTAPVKDAPYRFDYRKIFSFKEAARGEDKVKQEILKALNSELELERDGKPPADIIADAVKDYTIKTFKQKTREYNARQIKEEEQRQKQKNTLLSFELDYYDPEDEQLMRTMLKEALQILAQDPKYVLASMPDSEKFPFLTYWMYWRYGRTFTQSQLTAVYRKSMPILHALNRMTINVLLPSARKLGPAIFVPYSCHDYLVKKTNRIRRSYYKYLDGAIMDQSRCLYLTMNPHLCISGTPNNTYFAYMPSHVSDIHHFHVWRPTEYMHAKEEHHKRVAQARRSIS